MIIFNYLCKCHGSSQVLLTIALRNLFVLCRAKKTTKQAAKCRVPKFPLFIFSAVPYPIHTHL